MPVKRKHTEPMTLAGLKLLHDDKKIWLNPEYQRDSVWTISQKRLLIDSLLNNIDVPKIYLREIHKDSYEFEAVDGQQRLRTVFEFFSNKFALDEDADPVDGHEVAGKRFQDLATRVQISLQGKSLDITHLIDYTDDDVEDMFLRLQNGTPLNAAEKRRAISGDVSKIVRDLSEHKVFELVNFSAKRFAHEDAAAKVLHLELAGKTVDLKPASIKKTYETNLRLDSEDPRVRRIRKTWNFIEKAFRDKQNPKFKKYAIITISSVAKQLLEEYDLASHASGFADAYLEFEAARIKNTTLEEDKQDAELTAFTERARNDSVDAMDFRHDILKKWVIGRLPSLKLLDPTRSFSSEQRFFIFNKYKGVCQVCKQQADEGTWHADHIVPHSRGGATSIENGQLLHISCNLKKSNRIPAGA